MSWLACAPIGPPPPVVLLHRCVWAYVLRCAACVCECVCAKMIVFVFYLFIGNERFVTNDCES